MHQYPGLTTRLFLSFVFPPPGLGPPLPTPVSPTSTPTFPVVKRKRRPLSFVPGTSEGLCYRRDDILKLPLQTPTESETLSPRQLRLRALYVRTMDKEEGETKNGLRGPPHMGGSGDEDFVYEVTETTLE